MIGSVPPMVGWGEDSECVTGAVGCVSFMLAPHQGAVTSPTPVHVESPTQLSFPIALACLAPCLTGLPHFMLLGLCLKLT